MTWLDILVVWSLGLGCGCVATWVGFVITDIKREERRDRAVDAQILHLTPRKGVESDPGR